MQFAFQLLQTVYWIGLASWFGGAVFIVVAGPMIFRVVQEQDPTLPRVLSVNLDAQHSTLLSSVIVGRMMQALTRAALVFAIAIAVGLLAQAIILRPYGAALVQMTVRACLFLFVAGVLLYDWRSLSPRLFAQRQHFFDNADDPDVANESKERFERLSRESVNVLFLQTLLLLGMILFSASITYAPQLGR